MKLVRSTQVGSPGPHKGELELLIASRLYVVALQQIKG